MKNHPNNILFSLHQTVIYEKFALILWSEKFWANSIDLMMRYRFNINVMISPHLEWNNWSYRNMSSKPKETFNLRNSDIKSHIEWSSPCLGIYNIFLCNVIPVLKSEWAWLLYLSLKFRICLNPKCTSSAFYCNLNSFLKSITF